MLIPLEVKHSLGNFMVHAKQLCSYISKVGTCPSFAGQTVVGILRDDSYYHLAFAACQDKEGKSLPLLFLSPPLCWRKVTIHPLMVDHSSILLLSALHLLDIERLQMEVADIVVEVQRKLYEEPYVPLKLNQDQSLPELLAALAEKDA